MKRYKIDVGCDDSICVCELIIEESINGDWIKYYEFIDEIDSNLLLLKRREREYMNNIKIEQSKKKQSYLIRELQEGTPFVVDSHEDEGVFVIVDNKIGDDYRTFLKLNNLTIESRDTSKKCYLVNVSGNLEWSYL